MVSDDELENQDQGGEVNVAVVRKALADIYGEDLDDEAFEAIVLCAPAVSLVYAKGEITEDDLYVLADNAVYGMLGDEEYESLSEEDAENEMGFFVDLMATYVENIDAETPYGSLEEAVLTTAAQTIDDIEGGVDFTLYMLREVVAANDEPSDEEKDTLSALCELFGFTEEDIFEELEGEE
jgi:hypothetical protein